MILTVYSGREEGEWFDIDVPDECTIEHLKTLLGVRIFGQAPGMVFSIFWRLSFRKDYGLLPRTLSS